MKNKNHPLTLLAVLFLSLTFLASCKKNETLAEESKPDIYKNIKFINDWIPQEGVALAKGPNKLAAIKGSPLNDILTSWVAQGNIFQPGKNLKVGFLNNPSVMNAETARDQVFNGIRAWFAINVPNISVSISYITNVQSADVKVGWYKGNHGDGANNAFDGPGGTLAHAFYPTNGVIHFDDDENWSASLFGPEPSTIDLASVAAHEFGHTIGLNHSECSNATMTPYYFGLAMRTLSIDDVVGSRTIYGNNPNYENGMIGNLDMPVGQEVTFTLFYGYDFIFSPIGNPPIMTYNPNNQPPFRYSSLNWVMPPGVDLISGQGTSQVVIKPNGQFTGDVIMKAYISDCNATTEIKSMVANIHY